MPLFDALLELADDHLVLGHRVSEWCGHAPMLEEDLAMPNMALDMIGTARSLYEYAGQVEGKGRGEDDLAYLRSERDYRNLLLVERPNGDFAHTMLRQLYFAAFMHPYWTAALSSEDETIQGIAGKAVKEMAYHIRHAGEWVIRLGDGTEESARRRPTPSPPTTPPRRCRSMWASCSRKAPPRMWPPCPAAPICARRGKQRSPKSLPRPG